jgi:hypothetical protein
LLSKQALNRIRQNGFWCKIQELCTKKIPLI